MRRCLQTVIGDSIAISTVGRVSTSQRPFGSTSQTHLPLNRATERQLERKKWIESRGVRPAGLRPADNDDESAYAIRKHLQYLRDPLKLGEFVRETLRSGDYKTCLSVVRAGSKNMQCVVSWNHIIDHLLHQGRMNEAIRIYNEVGGRLGVLVLIEHLLT
jgi:pentatricopeptide repeat protein